MRIRARACARTAGKAVRTITFAAICAATIGAVAAAPVRSVRVATARPRCAASIESAGGASAATVRARGRHRTSATRAAAHVAAVATADMAAAETATAAMKPATASTTVGAATSAAVTSATLGQGRGWRTRQRKECEDRKQGLQEGGMAHFCILHRRWPEPSRAGSPESPTTFDSRRTELVAWRPWGDERVAIVEADPIAIH